MTAVSSVVVGPEQHGVVRHALVIAWATRARVARRSAVATCVADPPTGARVYHWHFTDRLFGPTADAAAGAFCAATEAVPGRHVVTLHDVPGATGTDRDRRRAAAYRLVAGCCHAVVVASEHERRRLVAADVRCDVAVIPLPAVAPRGSSRDRVAAGVAGRRIGILGFIYPGKGHDDVITAAGALPGDVGIVAIGRASDGHDDLAAALQRAAGAAGRQLAVTGFLDEPALASALDGIDVPIVPARDVSASASLGTWIAAGRRPLVVANEFGREVAAMGPDLVTLYEPERLGPALVTALADPASTRRAGAVPAGLGIGAVAAAHLALYRRVDA